MIEPRPRALDTGTAMTVALRQVKLLIDRVGVCSMEITWREV